MNTNIILYDDQCRLCLNSMDFLRSQDTDKQLVFYGFGSVRGQAIMKTHALKNTDSVILITEHNVFYKSNAVLQSLKRLSPSWKIFAQILQIFPEVVRDGFYNFVARNRYRFNKKQPKS